VVHFHSASLHVPDTVCTASLPERSAPQLLIAAPSGGLQTLSAKRMRWAYHHLLFSLPAYTRQAFKELITFFNS
jgi:hypothetical protein